MLAATLFSGIGAPETAMPHWDWRWHAEIEPFPSAVLAARHAQSQNLKDVTADGFADRAAGIARPDVLVFGSPCQSFSVAGRRLGLDDPRGNLALVALRIVARLAPRWFVFENVPGLLSSAEGRDFGLFLRAVDEIGYSLCWAVLDAQHFGLAQRRQRVFVVGHLGDWRYPAAVLLEPEGLCGDSPPRRQAGQGVASTIAARTKGGGGLGTDFDCDGGLGDCGGGSEVLVARSLNAHPNCNDGESETFVTHALRADGFDASEDGTGRGTPLIAFDTTQITSKTNRCQPQNGNACHPLAAGAHAPAIAFHAPQNPDSGPVTHPLDTHGYSIGGAFDLRGRENGSQFEGPHHTANIRASSGGSSRSYVQSSAVRRLTPMECERLQGFPDRYTAITYRGKPAADGPRYKALGNSMAVPVVRWILRRIELLHGS